MKSDSELTVHVFRGVKVATANGDLWAELDRLVGAHRATGGTFTLEWVKGHSEAQHLLDGTISTMDMMGNYGADALASAAASKAKVWPGDALAYFWTLQIAGLVQKRLVAIGRLLCDDWAKCKARLQAAQRSRAPEAVLAERFAKAVQKQVPVGGLRVLSPHSLVVIDHRYFCTSCLRWEPHVGAARFLARCVPNAQLNRLYRAESCRGPRLVPNGLLPVRIGDDLVHESHKLKVVHGLYFCDVCTASACVLQWRQPLLSDDPGSASKGSVAE